MTDDRPPDHGAPPADEGPSGETPPVEPPVSTRWRRRRGGRRAARRDEAAPLSLLRRRWARWLGIAIGAGAVVAGLVWITLPDPREYASEWPERTAYMEGWLEAGDEGTRSIAYRPVPLSRIPEALRRAVLVSEDAGFYGHSGFDWHEVRAAIRDAWEERELPRGASTISQQLARNLYLSPSRNPLRKLREALITRRIEARLPKDRILELYLNVIELGPGIYGVEAAARHYFGKSVAGLTRREAAELAATIPSPRGNNPATRTRAFQWRARLAQARAFGGIEIDTLGPPPDTIQVAPPVLVDPAGDPAGADSTPGEPAPIDTLAGDTTAADTTPADTIRRELAPHDDSARQRPAPDTIRTDTIAPDTAGAGGWPEPPPVGRRLPTR